MLLRASADSGQAQADFAQSLLDALARMSRVLLALAFLSGALLQLRFGAVAKRSFQIPLLETRPNPRLERTGAQPARHGRASVGAGRSTAGR